MICNQHDLNLIWGSLLWDIRALMIAAGEKADADSVRHYFGVPEDVLRMIMHDSSNQMVRLINFVDENCLMNGEPADISNLKSPIAADGFYDVQSDLFKEQLVYPGFSRKEIPASVINDILESAAEASKKVQVLGERILIDVLEQKGSYISLNGGKSSVFENAKLRAGIALCLSMAGKNGSILICSFDFLGIKDFKFRKEFSSSPGTLCASSFYVDIMRENFLDDYYACTGLSYVNTIFSGGRHLHLFIPNTEEMRNKTKKYVSSFNSWLVRCYGTEMFVSYGLSDSGQLDIRSICGEERENRYKRYYSEIASQRNVMESSKYSAKDIIELKHIYSAEGRSDTDRKTKRIANLIFQDYDKRKLLRIFDRAVDKSVEIGPGRFLNIAGESDIAPVRCYWRKNGGSSISIPGVYGSSELCGIWYGGIPDLPQAENQNAFEQHNCAVLRLDIDNFREGMFGKSAGDDSDPAFAVKMEQSKHLGLFLRKDIYVLADRFVKSAGDKSYRKLLWIIHEGADDAFIAGEYRAVLEFSAELIHHYYRYSGNNMSFSGGICRYDSHSIDFADCAAFAQLLMDHAKEAEGKNSVVIEDDDHCIKWERII